MRSTTLWHALAACLPALLGAWLLLGVPTVAGAQQRTQAEPESPYVAVAEDGAALRCGAGTTWYVVARLDPGTLLRVEGEVDDWLRVEYPRGLPAVVKAIEGEHRPDEGVVVLTRRSALWALDRSDPYIEACYKRIFAEKPLEAGTRLKYLGPIQDRRGNLAGFKVVAPEGATGFVLPADVRAATEAELEAMRAARAAEEMQQGDQPAEQAPDEEQPAEPTPQPERAPEGDEPGPDGDPEQMQPEPETETPEMEMGEDEGAEEEAAPAEATIDDLDAAFERLQRQPLEEAEFQPLIEEYRELRSRLRDEPGADVERVYIDARIELLEIRAEVQEKLRRVAELRAESRQAREELDRLVASLQDARSYAAVGRLLPSAIYDGERLPRMYRVQSVGSGGRTIAYVLPEEALGLEGMLGSIVGVRGAMEAETSGRVRVIRPETVDLLRTEAEAETQ